ncbi:MAG TPA: hypothetical protein VMQ51_04625 [Candidatus Binatia bacterium]|nr:hypothetical protein [Candidatus Binatia bacterium]
MVFRGGVRALGILLLASGGCATLSNDTPWTVISPRTTLQVGSEERFRLDWTVGADRTGAPLVEGYVYNVSMYPVERARLLISACDRSGAVVGQRLFWLAGSLPTGARTYFDLPAPPADHYQVTLWDFNIVPRGQ